MTRDGQIRERYYQSLKKNPTRSHQWPPRSRPGGGRAGQARGPRRGWPAGARARRLRLAGELRLQVERDALSHLAVVQVPEVNGVAPAA
jgi:hypothetical protein